MELAVTFPQDGPKGLTVRVAGVLSRELELTPILDFSARETLKGLRLDGVSWLIQEKLGLRVWWRRDRESSDLLLIAEGKNGYKELVGVSSASDWRRMLWLESFAFDRVPEKPVSFILTLDFDKQ